LEEMVLHDISNDAKLVKVPTTSLGSKRFLEGDLDVVDVISVPGGPKELITKPQNQNVLDHLLSKVMINTENLLLAPVGLQSLLQLSRASKILTEWLLNLDKRC
jgi:hypothetical protein